MQQFCHHLLELHFPRHELLSYPAEFNRVLELQAREFESAVLRLELSLEATRRMYENLIEEGQNLTGKYQWIDKRVIRMIESFKKSDDFDFSELDF